MRRYASLAASLSPTTFLAAGRGAVVTETPSHARKRELSNTNESQVSRDG